MRPHLLTMTAFGPYAGTVEVNFDELAPHGLFLLHGPTGAGKTSLLDGLVYALYGDLPSAKGSRDTKALRSDHADPNVLCTVTLEATIAGKRIRIKRSPQQMRPKDRGTGLTKSNATALLEELQDGEWATMSTRPQEVGPEITARMVMNDEQFAQVAMLQQGRFAKFLHSTTEDRAKLLEALFATQRFRRIEHWLGLQRNELSKAVESQERVIDDLVSRFSEAAGVAAFDEDAVEASTDDALDPTADPTTEAAPTKPTRIDWARALLAQTTESAMSSAATVALAADALTTATKQREHAEAIVKASEAHQAASRRVTELIARNEAIGAMKLELDRAVSAAPIAEKLSVAQAASARATDAHTVLSEALTELTDVAEVEGTSPEHLVALKDETLKHRGRLEALGPREQDLAEARRELSEADNDATRFAGRVKEQTAKHALAVGALVRIVGDLEQRHEIALAESEAAYSQEQAIREARRRGAAAEVAKTLVAGEPCAVCGSTEHPAPASSDHDHVSQDDEDAAIASAKAAERAAGKVSEELTLARSELGKLDVVPGSADDAPVRDAESASALGRRITELASLIAQDSQREQDAATRAEAARARVESLAATFAEAIAPHESLSSALEAADDLIELLENTVEAHTQSEKAQADSVAAQHALNAALTEAGIADSASIADAVRGEDWRSSAAQEIADHTTNLAVAEERLAEAAASVVEVDLPAAVAAEAEAKAQHTAQVRLAATATDRKDRLEKLLPELTQALEDAAPMIEAKEVARNLANLAEGGAGNAKNMKLSTYVLTARLEAVAAAASVKLATMSDGRYTLEHSDEKVGNERVGLGLRVNDSHTGKARDTSTLSGGETFMASLALALGLAEVVGQESGGRPIEALFVDEGFGTLDEQTLDQVMDVLDGLRQGGRIVGVVSHVRELRERIPAKIEVTRTSTGSTLQVLGV